MLRGIFTPTNESCCLAHHLPDQRSGQLRCRMLGEAMHQSLGCGSGAGRLRGRARKVRGRLRDALASGKTDFAPGGPVSPLPSLLSVLIVRKRAG